MKAPSASTRVRVGERDGRAQASKQEPTKHRYLPGRSLSMRRGCHAPGLHPHRILAAAGARRNTRAPLASLDEAAKPGFGVGAELGIGFSLRGRSFPFLGEFMLSGLGGGTEGVALRGGIVAGVVW
jgi:hypothetical protein